MGLGLKLPVLRGAASCEFQAGHSLSHQGDLVQDSKESCLLYNFHNEAVDPISCLAMPETVALVDHNHHTTNPNHQVLNGTMRGPTRSHVRSNLCGQDETSTFSD